MSWVKRAYGCDCGALDCPICHPENCVDVECPCCGKVVYRYELVGDTCEDCYFAGAMQCEDCGEWSLDIVCFDGNFVCEACMLEREQELLNPKPIPTPKLCTVSEERVKELEDAIKRIEIEFTKGARN